MQSEPAPSSVNGSATREWSSKRKQDNISAAPTEMTKLQKREKYGYKRERCMVTKMSSTMHDGSQRHTQRATKITVSVTLTGNDVDIAILVVIHSELGRIRGEIPLQFDVLQADKNKEG